MMQIVKNLGNYEGVRLEAEFELNSSDVISESFLRAKERLEESFFLCYKDHKQEAEERTELLVSDKIFDRICNDLYKKKTDLNDLQKYYIISPEAFNYFVKHKLI